MKDVKKWFIMNRGDISGPFTFTEAEREAEKLTDPLFWGRGLAEWLPSSDWKRAVQMEAQQLDASLNPTPSLWKFKADGEESGSMDYVDLIATLKKRKNFDSVSIQRLDTTDGWRDLFSVQKIVDALGISRRNHLRVPIMGQLFCEDPTGREIELRVVTISEGGLGINGESPYPIGQTFRGLLKSSNLYSDIHCQVETVYAGSDGYTGLQFSHLPSEAHAAIVEYVKKFKELES